MLSVVTDDGSTQSGSLIDEIVREGARRMLAAGLEAEVNQYIAELTAETDSAGRRLVVRNGHHQIRTVVTAAFPAARPQRCWVHTSRNVTNCLPKSAQPGATKAMQEIYNAEDRGHAEKAIEAFAKRPRSRWCSGWSSQLRLDGVRSPVPIWCPWSAPGHGSRTASSSNARSRQPDWLKEPPARPMAELAYPQAG